MSVDMEITATGRRVKRSSAELKEARIAKAQKRLNRVTASGEKVVRRAEVLQAKAAAAQEKADQHGEELAFAEASLAHEMNRPLKGAATRLGGEAKNDVEDDVKDGFTFDDDELAVDEDYENEDADEDITV